MIEIRITIDGVESNEPLVFDVAQRKVAMLPPPCGTTNTRFESREAPVPPAGLGTPELAASGSEGQASLGWDFEVLGQRGHERTPTAAFVRILSLLAAVAPDEIPRLAEAFAGRTRSLIAPTPEQIYARSRLKHRRGRHAKQFARNWFVDTNMDTERKIAVVKRICEILGLSYDRDIKMFEVSAG